MSSLAWLTNDSGNLLLDWTLIGWVIALVWACKKPAKFRGDRRFHIGKPYWSLTVEMQRKATMAICLACAW